MKGDEFNTPLYFFTGIPAVVAIHGAVGIKAVNITKSSCPVSLRVCTASHTKPVRLSVIICDDKCPDPLFQTVS
jgi:hypothetical protein